MYFFKYVAQQGKKKKREAAKKTGMKVASKRCSNEIIRVDTGHALRSSTILKALAKLSNKAGFHMQHCWM